MGFQPGGCESSSFLGIAISTYLVLIFFYVLCTYLYLLERKCFTFCKIPDEDIIPDKEVGESSSALPEPDRPEQEKQLQYQYSSLSLSSEAAESVCWYCIVGSLVAYQKSWLGIIVSNDAMLYRKITTWFRITSLLLHQLTQQEPLCMLF